MKPTDCGLTAAVVGGVAVVVVAVAVAVAVVVGVAAVVVAVAVVVVVAAAAGVYLPAEDVDEVYSDHVGVRGCGVDL